MDYHYQVDKIIFHAFSTVNLDIKLIDAHNIHFDHLLQMGTFGAVYKAKWNIVMDEFSHKPTADQFIDVAVRLVRNVDENMIIRSEV
jgi:hypothetical protein